MSNKQFYIVQPTINEQFSQHIGLDDNRRILFSAKFGTGKSTFLNQFFLDNNKYIVLKLYPVNYSVASNEDVFELIKYDLFAEILAKYANVLNMNEEDFSTLLVAQSYAIHDLKFYPFVKALLKAIVPGADAFMEVADAAKDIYERFTEYQKTVSRDSLKVIDDYTKWCEQKKGSIYERDEITSLLTDLIRRVKSASNDKPVVLIVDDLDRLDPEHVFRLFNIFSAHYDATTAANKFELDKVIFVCDYENIKLMYTHRYGAGVDFEGYINKFFSIKVFNYDNHRHLRERMADYLAGKPMIIPNIFTINGLYNRVDSNSLFIRALALVLSDLIEGKLINFRDLDKIHSLEVPQKTINLGFAGFPSGELPFIFILHNLFKAIDAEKFLSYIQNRSATIGNLSLSNLENQAKFDQYWLVNQTLIFLFNPDEIDQFYNFPSTTLRFNTSQYRVAIERLNNVTLPILNLNLNNIEHINIYTFIYQATQKCINSEYV